MFPNFLSRFRTATLSLSGTRRTISRTLDGAAENLVHHDLDASAQEFGS